MVSSSNNTCFYLQACLDPPSRFCSSNIIGLIGYSQNKTLQKPEININNTNTTVTPPTQLEPRNLNKTQELGLVGRKLGIKTDKRKMMWQT